MFKDLCHMQIMFFLITTLHRSCAQYSSAQSLVLQSNSGANPTIASHNASVVNFYNATDNLVRFKKHILF
jgi:hypothetical protein